MNERTHTFVCKCGWTGDSPSMSDASAERELSGGRVVVDRTHLAICPRCFEIVKRVERSEP